MSIISTIPSFPNSVVISSKDLSPKLFSTQNRVHPEDLASGSTSHQSHLLSKSDIVSSTPSHQNTQLTISDSSSDIQGTDRHNQNQQQQPPAQIPHPHCSRVHSKIPPILPINDEDFDTSATTTPRTASISPSTHSFSSISQHNRRPLTKSQKMFQFLQNIQNYCLHVVHSIYKYIIHIITGDCELVRICSENDRRHTYLMTSQFTHCLKQSTHLASIAKMVTFPTNTNHYASFTINEVLLEIMTKKKIQAKSPVIIANMKTCLQSIRFMNKLCIDCQQLRSIAFDYNQMEHVQLLEKLWCSLKPTVIRSSNRLSEEWGDLGFQGKDPSTDFRGMGLLSLQQLVYFSEKYPGDAQQLLQESLIETRYFPFSAVGINITAFVVELLNGLNLHQYIYQNMDKIMLQDVMNSDNGPSEDKHCVELGMVFIHELYCKVFIDFGKVWVKLSPQDVMSFPTIFADFKKQVKKEYQAI